jgi:hypothetical protein
MKRFGVPLLAVLLWLSLSALAQYGNQQSSTNDQQASTSTTTQSASQTSTTTDKSAGKLHKLNGKISDDGKTFTSAKDNKTWTISNPDAVKGHEGHDVRLSAHVYPEKNEIHVMSVKMPGEKSSKPKGGAMSEQSPQ